MGETTKISPDYHLQRLKLKQIKDKRNQKTLEYWTNLYKR